GISQVELWYNRNSTVYWLYNTDFAAPWSFNFNSSATGGDGLYEFYSIAYDNAGNVEIAPLVPPDTLTIVDTQNPLSQVSPLPIYTILEVSTVDVIVQSDPSGIDKVELWYNRDSNGWTFYGQDMSSPWSFSFDSSTTGGDGFYELYSITYDSAGNAEVVPVVPEASTTIDTLKPSSVVDMLPQYTNTSALTVDVTVMPDLNGIQKVELWYRNGLGIWTLYGTDTFSPWSFNFDTATTGGNDLYNFYARAYDIPGNYEDAPASPPYTSTMVDTIKPEIEITEPLADEWVVLSDVTLKWTGSDDGSGIEHYEVKIDDTKWLYIAASSQHIFGNVLEGSHTVTVRAFDNAMNVNTTSIDFSVDLTRPSLTITMPANNTKTNSTSVTVVWVGFDTGSDIDHFEVKLDDRGYIDVGKNNSYTLTQLDSGTRIIWVKAIDNAGHHIEYFINVEVEDPGSGEHGIARGGLFDLLMEFWWILLLLIVAIIVIIAALVVVRRKRKEEFAQKGPALVQPAAKPQTQKPSAQPPVKKAPVQPRPLKTPAKPPAQPPKPEPKAASAQPPAKSKTTTKEPSKSTPVVDSKAKSPDVIYGDPDDNIDFIKEIKKTKK
ncbi:MAG: hypothetical protein KAI64_04855, partial [Thermoplasmata archaeon]|nr:hypothetical protein [Thermoplasmata archaeon]